MLVRFTLLNGNTCKSQLHFEEILEISLSFSEQTGMERGATDELLVSALLH